MPSAIKRHSKKAAGCLCCFGGRTISDDASSITSNNVGNPTEYTTLLDPLTKKRFPSIFTRWKRRERAAPVPTNPFTVATDGVSDSTDSVGDVTDSEPDHDWLPALPADIPARGAENHRHPSPLLGSWPDSLKQWLVYDKFSADNPAGPVSITRSSSWETADRDISELTIGSPLAGRSVGRLHNSNTPKQRIAQRSSTRSLRRVAAVPNIRERASGTLQVSPQHVGTAVSTSQPRSGELTGQPSTRRATSAARLPARELRYSPFGRSAPSTSSWPQRQLRPTRLPIDWAETSEMALTALSPYSACDSNSMCHLASQACLLITSAGLALTRLQDWRTSTTNGQCHRLPVMQTNVSSDPIPANLHSDDLLSQRPQRSDGLVATELDARKSHLQRGSAVLREDCACLRKATRTILARDPAGVLRLQTRSTTPADLHTWKVRLQRGALVYLQDESVCPHKATRTASARDQTVSVL